MKILTIGNVPLDPFLGSGKKRLAWFQGMKSRGHSIDIFEPKDFEFGFGKIQKAKKFRQAIGAYRFFKKIDWRSYDLIEFCGDEFWLIQQYLLRQKDRPLLVASTDGLELLASESSLKFAPPKGVVGKIRALFNNSTHRKFSKIAFSHADAFVSVAALDREYVVEKGLFRRERTQVIHNCIDPEFYRSFSEERENRIAFTGSWIDRKGVSIVEDIMEEMLGRYRDLQFDVFGASGDKALIYGSFPEKYHDRIHVYPKISNQELSDRLAKVKVFFFPTQYEGFGIATAEAMACGCAVVTTPTGYGWELKDGLEAVVCDFHDLKKMKNALEALLGDEQKRLAIAKKGWELSQELRWERSLAILESSYEKWLSQWRRNR